MARRGRTKRPGSGANRNGHAVKVGSLSKGQLARTVLSGCFALGLIFVLRDSAIMAVKIIALRAGQTADQLPFSRERLLKLQYGTLYTLVRRASTGLPRGIYPKVRSGVELRHKEPRQILGITSLDKKLISTNALYVVHGIPRDQIDQAFVITAPPATANLEPMEVRRGDTVRFAFTAVQMSSAGTVMFDSIDAIRIPLATSANGRISGGLYLEETKDDLSSARLLRNFTLSPDPSGVVTVQFSPPVDISFYNCLLRYHIVLEASQTMQIAVTTKVNPKHQLIVGDGQIEQRELACVVLGRLVNTDGVELIEAPTPNGLIYVDKAILSHVARGIDNGRPDEIIEAVGTYVASHLEQGTNAERSGR